MKKATAAHFWLMGGLGNALFQLNFAWRLRELGRPVVCHTSLIESGSVPLKLLSWTNHGTLAHLHLLGLDRHFAFTGDFPWSALLVPFSKRRNGDFLSTRYYGLTSPQPFDILARNIFGYFHINNDISVGFIECVRAGIREYVERHTSTKFQQLLLQSRNLPVVHIRGGDYAKDPNFRLSHEYYRRATLGLDRFLVVTNDRELSCSVLSGVSGSYSFADSGGALEDFVLLASSEVKILSNSTFSWWAAEVGEPKSKIFQPNPYFCHIDWAPISKMARVSVSAISPEEV